MFNHFQLELEFGTVVIVWNDKGLIEKIQLKPALLLTDQETPFTRKFSGSMPTAKRIPTDLVLLMDRILNFLTTGTPIGPTPWELIQSDGWSEFQKKVFYATSVIPTGETRNYGWIAKKIGSSLANRAVGQTLSKNPVPLLIPCHRVVHSKGTLGGFMGVSDPQQPEMLLKEKLLLLEERYMHPTFGFLPGAIPNLRLSAQIIH